MLDYETHELGDVVVQSGHTMRSARLAYKAYGQLNDRRDNVLDISNILQLAAYGQRAHDRPGDGAEPREIFTLYH